jgi:shikimate dehydrogenase
MPRAHRGRPEGGGMKRALVGLIGANIQRSLSPVLHEDAFAAAGIRGHYHLMDLDRLPGRALADLLGAARSAGFAGVNITYPCKEAVLPLLDAVSPEARQIGAVNTVTFDGQGRMTGHNSDRHGFRASFEESLGRAAVAGKSVVLVGAGGAGRAVAYALFDLGAAAVLVFDSDRPRAAALARDLTAHFGAGRGRAVDALAPALAAAAGAVNATPVGMLGFPGIPVSAEAIEARQFVADVIYTPLETALIRAARARGARVLTGGGMCVFQAAEAFRLFTGIAPDVGRMRRLFDEIAAARDAALGEIATVA